jgi:hypothetical protein
MDLSNNIYNNLLLELKNNWPWILFSQKDYFLAQCPINTGCLSELSTPVGITGSNFNSSNKLTIKVHSPSCLYFFNEIKPVLILSINEFFKAKIINQLVVIS